MAEPESNSNLQPATSTTDNTTTEPPAPVKKKGKFRGYLLLTLLFIVVLLGIVYAADKYVIKPFNDRYFAEPKNIEPPVQEEIYTAESPKFEKQENAENQPGETAGAVEVEVEPAAPEITEPVVEVRPTPNYAGDIGLLNEKLEKLSEQNRNIMVYFAVRDLKDAIGDKEKFSAEITNVKMLIGDNPDIQGRLDILQQSTGENFETAAALKLSLKKVEEAVEKNSAKGFEQRIKSILGGLVKVTKVEGDVEATDYKSIIKRAEIALSETNISSAKLQGVIDEMAKLGKPAENWVRRASNLRRIMAVTDYLLDYSKTKVTQSNQ